MTHVPGREIDGEFTGGSRSDRPCPKCHADGTVTFRVWESSDGGWEDYKYSCSACKKTWWVDGIDS